MSVVVTKPGDIMLTRSQGFVAGAIRFFTRKIGESRTRANHVGVVVEGGLVPLSVIVEAVSKVRQCSIFSAYANRNVEVSLYRPKNISGENIELIVDEARSYVGRSYGYGKIVAHVLDWTLFGAYVFRRFANMEKYPICSYLVAKAFGRAGYKFGVEAGAASPDDIWDFVNRNPDKYECIRPLSRLT